MKKTIAIVLTLFLLAGSFTVLAAMPIAVEGSDISLEVPQTFTALTAQNLQEHSALLDRIGETPQSMQRFLTDGGYFFVALSEDLRYQISLSGDSDALSQTAGNLLDLELDEREQMKKRMIGSVLADGQAQVKEKVKNGALFYRVVIDPRQAQSSELLPVQSVSVLPEDGSAPSAASAADVSGSVSSGQTAGSAPVASSASEPGTVSSAPATPQPKPEAKIFYITLLNGKYYTLCFTDKAGMLDDNAHNQIDYVFETMQFEVSGLALQQQATRQRVTMVVTVVGIVLALAAIVWLVWSIRSELSRRKMENDWKRKSRKRPRR